MNSREKNEKHIEQVKEYMNGFLVSLMARMQAHDQTKLRSPEAEIFEEYTPKLAECTYGSEEYKRYLSEMEVALDHHYAHNPHHPEHFENGVADMTLIDLIEMVCDWKAASMRHDDGDIRESIRINRDRFNLDVDIGTIIENTVDILETMDEVMSDENV